MPHWTNILLHDNVDKRGERHTFAQIRDFHRSYKDLKAGVVLEESDALTRIAAGETGISRPWKEPGHHWAIAEIDGNVETIMLRPMTQNGAHARERNFNKRAIGVLMCGWDERHLEALLKLCRVLMKTYKISVEGIVGRWEFNYSKATPEGFDINEFRQTVQISLLEALLRPLQNAPESE